MNSIPLAMTWEFWNKHRWNLLLSCVAMAALPTLIFGAILARGVQEIPRQGLIPFHIVWTLIQTFFLGAM